jgi:hypothetical protein
MLLECEGITKSFVELLWMAVQKGDPPLSAYEYWNFGMFLVTKSGLLRAFSDVG